MRAALVPAIALALVTACSSDSSPKAFLTNAIQGDNSEIQLGAAAAQRGGPAVQGFGQMLVTSHSKARQAAVGVAANYGLNPSDSISDDANDEHEKLAKLEGSAFDAEFIRYMIDDHTKDIAAFEKVARSDAPADIRQLAAGTLPDLRNHLAMAQSLK